MDTISKTGFLRGLFSDADGSPSVENIISVFVILCAISWVTYIVAKTHALPDGASLTGLTAFCAAHHFSAKLSGAFGNKS